MSIALRRGTCLAFLASKAPAGSYVQVVNIDVFKQADDTFQYMLEISDGYATIRSCSAPSLTHLWLRNRLPCAPLFKWRTTSVGPSAAFGPSPSFVTLAQLITSSVVIIKKIAATGMAPLIVGNPHAIDVVALSDDPDGFIMEAAAYLAGHTPADVDKSETDSTESQERPPSSQPGLDGAIDVKPRFRAKSINNSFSLKMPALDPVESDEEGRDDLAAECIYDRKHGLNDDTSSVEE
ncbi:hypothetical protein DACRYDRAFT_112051 [Dacryopinax primogenitus]|uniref:Uncharacterized protein n=1 Tax=Dacryopinax primogenitus (strain DJM 731) TaxID=1858805 RepID=M5FQP9_DACPD|nr:uncharacterized protein DACRYDRAFT_112051 [Dacryopinax primogenitus]EJT97089.1 hypothetical protein DACRYDRAFT_112051 [Dacryopinax primogenitus]